MAEGAGLDNDGEPEEEAGSLQSILRVVSSLARTYTGDYSKLVAELQHRGVSERCWESSLTKEVVTLLFQLPDTDEDLRDFLATRVSCDPYRIAFWFGAPYCRFCSRVCQRTFQVQSQSPPSEGHPHFSFHTIGVFITCIAMGRNPADVACDAYAHILEAVRERSGREEDHAVGEERRQSFISELSYLLLLFVRDDEAKMTLPIEVVEETVSLVLRRRTVHTRNQPRVHADVYAILQLVLEGGYFDRNVCHSLGWRCVELILLEGTTVAIIARCYTFLCTLHTQSPSWAEEVGGWAATIYCNAPTELDLWLNTWMNPSDGERTLSFLELILSSPSSFFILELQRRGRLHAFCEQVVTHIVRRSRLAEEADINAKRRETDAMKRLTDLLFLSWPSVTKPHFSRLTGYPSLLPSGIASLAEEEEEDGEEEGSDGRSVCPLTLSRMVFPVVASDGRTYEKDALLSHMVNDMAKRARPGYLPAPISPFTRLPLSYALYVSR